VLAGEKSKLASESEVAALPFAGSGQKLGGHRADDPAAADTRGAGAGKKKVVTAEGKIAFVQAKGVTDSMPEREKRAAAALARINAMQKAAQAAGGGDEGAAQL
jgi:hypothetical protein